MAPQNPLNLKTLTFPVRSPIPVLQDALQRGQDLLLRQQFSEGYWWYALEANESICAEYIFLAHFLGLREEKLHQAICRRILTQQREDGSWALFYGGPGDLGGTLECYWALKLCGYPIDHPAMKRGRKFILKAGGPTKARVFTKIHMAMFGLAPWEAAPAMPVSLILAPAWVPLNIYEFSSWARASIVPLLVILNEKPVHPLTMDLEELYPEPPSQRNWQFEAKGKTSSFTLENFFLVADRFMKGLQKIPRPRLLKTKALKACEKYIRDHIARTEDIFPAMAYGAFAMKTLGFGTEDPAVAKAVAALKRFQQPGAEDLPPIPDSISEKKLPEQVYQQCCISPIWDTAWGALSLIESGMSVEEPPLKKSLKYLLEKQVLWEHGDWSVKNKRGAPGGWAFEFENDFFPDVDDTIEVLTLLYRMGLTDTRRQESFDLGLQWLLSMQSKNGGWAAFDVDNTLQWVNRIPFSDHGACLDPPTPDLTGRVLELLALIGHDRKDKIVREAIEFIYREQEICGAWWGRWGVNYLYGTWCVLQGLIAIGESPNHPKILKATHWLLEMQNADGGWGESCDGYRQGKFVNLGYSVPSQTAWGALSLLAVGMAPYPALSRAMEFLLSGQNADGGWDEREFTGTGFPGHFYIRYHGYRHYFPLVALAKYHQAITQGNGETKIQIVGGS